MNKLYKYTCSHVLYIQNSNRHSEYTSYICFSSFDVRYNTSSSTEHVPIIKPL